jgi:hypothetical protein
MYGFEFNYLAIAVAALVAFMIGALWYSPLLFGNLWVKAHGYSPADIEGMRAGAKRAMLVALVSTVVMAFVLATLIQLTPIIRWQGGAKLGALCWLGFAATIGLTSTMYSGKKLPTYYIDAAYQLVYMIWMGAILAGWR